ncbi:unnamed protein product [Porites evermanni]|uniref:Fibronectin type-III domain-containing protein n=1 Tax=Porites evermanni TaxID=104178 RepID=A0ABN8QVA3_9CNID|nr:unnamed protein product [Porites evermanni]
MQRVDEGSDYTRKRRSLSDTRTDHDYQPVHSLKAVVLNASSIVLTWEKPPDIANPRNIKGYQIKMSYTADGRHKMELSNATMTSSTFRFLDFNTRYTFEVRTRFRKDNSLGPPVHVIKTTDAFTAPVSHLMAKAGYNSVILTWSAPGTIKPKALKLYMVNWNCIDCYYGQRNGDQACPRTNCTIPNLQRGHRYSFSVHAVTDFGDGESSVISMLISRYYGKVRNLQAIVDNNYNMTIKWDPPINVDVKNIKFIQKILVTPSADGNLLLNETLAKIEGHRERLGSQEKKLKETAKREKYEKYERMK